MKYLGLFIMLAGLAPVCAETEIAATRTLAFTADLRANGALPPGDNLIEQCVPFRDSLYFLVKLRRSGDRQGSLIVITDESGRLRRRFPLAVANPVSICGVAERRVRLFQIPDGRPVVVDYDHYGNLLASYESEVPLAGVTEAPSGAVVAALTDGRLAILSLEDGKAVVRRSLDMKIAAGEQLCWGCPKQYKLLPGGFSWVWFSPDRVGMIFHGTAALYSFDLARWEVEKTLLRSPKIEQSVAYFDARRQRLRELSPHSRTAQGIVVLSAAVDSDGTLLVLSSPHWNRRAIVERFDARGRHLESLVCPLEGLGGADGRPMPYLVAVSGKRLTLICRRPALLAAYGRSVRALLK